MIRQRCQLTGKYLEKQRSGLELCYGKSKDYRPDLKQLVFNLSITSDGAVPIHYKTYSGNRTDDTIHIEIWNTLCRIHSTRHFIYVADCKVCTSKQLDYIVNHQGRVISILPETWREVNEFKKNLKARTQKKMRNMAPQ